VNPLIVPPGKPGNNLDSKTATLMVEDGGHLTPQQFAQVQHAFFIHLMAVRTSSAGYMVRDTQLPDGSRVRMVSNSGMHTVQVWPALFAHERLALPHGFAVRTDWHMPTILGYMPGSNTWGIHNVPPVLQIRDEAPMSDNQIVRAGAAFVVVLPMVYVDKRNAIWDYAPHHVRNDYGDGAVPVNTSFVVEGTTRFYPHKYHFAFHDKIKSLKGVDLYTMVPAAQIADEPAVYFPANTDSNGNYVLLQGYRVASTSIINPDFLLWRFWSEVLQRTAMEVYTLSTREDVDVNTPIGTSQSHTAVVTGDLGEDGNIELFMVQFMTNGGISWFPGWGKPSIAFNVVRYFLDFSGPPNNSSAVYNYVGTEVAGAIRTFSNAIALPSDLGIEYIALEVNLGYTGADYFRGGYARRSFSTNLIITGSSTYGVYDWTKHRRDSQRKQSGSPKVKLSLVWAEVMLVDGVVQGELDGRLYIDMQEVFRQVAPSSQALVWTVAGMPPYNWETDPTGELSKAYIQALSGDYGFDAEWQAAKPSGHVETTLADIPVTNTGSYTLTSRHIIDFDARARFWAAIRVEVICAGAAWKQNPGSYRGDLIVDTNPSYDVKIYFESYWNTVRAQQLLLTASGSKPAFEFIKTHALNVYVYPGDDSSAPLDYYLPPQLSLGRDFMEGLLNLGSHQGVNTHLASADVRVGLPDGTDSPTGHELSYVEDGMEKPHRRRATGMLYARTFTLADSDIKKALWMLTQLTIDARLNNLEGNPDLWYYFPAIRAALTTKFHIELRNGVIEQWSDTLPGSESKPQPAAVDRDIKLYQV